jgi:cytochrome c556
MKKNLGFGFVLLLFLGGQDSSFTQGQNNQVSKLMAEKLKSSQKLLEGIAIGDFDKITTSAEKLIQLSNTEEWLQLKTARYEMHSNEFRRAAEALIQKAKSKNIDGATLAFFEMTMSCVRCHQYVREVRDARLPVPNPVGTLTADGRESPADRSLVSAEVP